MHTGRSENRLNLRALPLTLSAMMSTLSVILFLLYSVPLLNIIAVFTCALPVTYAGAVLGMRWAILSGLAASAVIGMIQSPIHAYWFLSLFGIMGAVTGTLMHMKHTPKVVFIRGTVITSVFFILGFYVIEAALGLQEIREAFTTLYHAKYWAVNILASPKPKPDPAAELRRIQRHLDKALPVPKAFTAATNRLGSFGRQIFSPFSEISEQLSEEFKYRSYRHFDYAFFSQRIVLMRISAIIPEDNPFLSDLPSRFRKADQFLLAEFKQLLSRWFSPNEIMMDAQISTMLNMFVDFIRLPLILSLASTLPPLFINYFAATLIFPRFGIYIRPLMPVYTWKLPDWAVVMILMSQFSFIWALYQGHFLAANLFQQLYLIFGMMAFLTGIGVLVFFMLRHKVPAPVRLLIVFIAFFLNQYVALLGMIDAFLDFRQVNRLKTIPDGPALMSGSEVHALKSRTGAHLT